MCIQVFVGSRIISMSLMGFFITSQSTLRALVKEFCRAVMLKISKLRMFGLLIFDQDPKP